MNCNRQPAVTAGILTGVTVVALGVLLLLGNLGILRPMSLFAFWPVVLVMAGVVNLVAGRALAQFAWGLLLAAAGVYWIASNMGYAPIPMRKIWPVFLIGLGLLFLWRALQRRQAGGGPPLASASTFNELAIFGGIHRALKTPDFRGGEAFLMCAGCELDLTQARIGVEQAVIEANVVFGGIEIRVPSDWRVNTQGVAIFGGFEDKTVHPREEAGNPPARQLIVRGMAMFGGVEIKN